MTESLGHWFDLCRERDARITWDDPEAALSFSKMQTRETLESLRLSSARIAELEADVNGWADAAAYFDAECDIRLADKNKYRTAWVSAFHSRRRWRAQLQVAEARIAELEAELTAIIGRSHEAIRDSEDLQAENDRLRAELAKVEAQLRQMVRDEDVELENAKARLAAVISLCDDTEFGDSALGLAILVRAAATGDSK